jgi:hypothetical protein
MKSDQIAQAKVDIDVALRLIELGHLEPAQELLRFASAELDDALSILEVGDIQLLASAPARHPGAADAVGELSDRRDDALPGHRPGRR